MASSYGNAPTINISTGVKAKLQKWLGKASSNVRDKRPANSQETLAEIMDYAPQPEISNGVLIPQHSRTRSAPIPMLNGDKVVKKPRKGSLKNSPVYSTRDKVDRENGRINSYPTLSHSMVLYESSSDPSSRPRKQNNTICYGKESSLGDQTDCVAGNTTVRDEKNMNSLNAKEVKSSRAYTKGNRPARAASKTSGEYSDESANSDNEKASSNAVFENSPNGLEQLSEQIQSRLHKWVERASYLAAMRGRRASEESASSTDDSLNPPESPNSRSPGSDAKSWKNESQVKKIKELELALKELVENIGVRSGKPDGTHSPSSSGQGSRHNSQRENEELIGNEKQNLLSKLPKDIGESGLRQNSSSDSDARVNTTAEVKSMIDNPGEEGNDLLSENQDDENDIILMKSGRPTRDLSNNGNPPPTQTLSRGSVELQEVLLCQTLIEQFPKQNDDDSATKIAPADSKKIFDDAIPKSKGTGREEHSFEVTGNKNRSGKTETTQGQNKTETAKLSETKARQGAGIKLERPKLRKQITAPDENALRKVRSELSVRESMRQYLNFKDADLSAFAVECVRHANKKKQVLREEEAEKENVCEKTLQPTKKTPNTKGTNGSQSARTTELNPTVIISSDEQTSEAKFTKTLAGSRGSSMDDETANETSEDGRRSRYVFARTSEEAEWFAKEFDQAGKESLGRSSSNPQQDAMTSQRLYKFPSMPMFYIPRGNVEAEKGAQKKNVKSGKLLAPQRRSIASFPSAVETLDPFYHGMPDKASKTKPRASSSLQLHGKDKDKDAHEVNNTKPRASSSVQLTQLTGEDRNDNEVKYLKQRANSSFQLSGKDKNDNETKKASVRPMMRKRKNSAPTRLALYPMSTSVRVDIEALI